MSLYRASKSSDPFEVSSQLAAASQAARAKKIATESALRAGVYAYRRRLGMRSSQTRAAFSPVAVNAVLDVAEEVAHLRAPALLARDKDGILIQFDTNAADSLIRAHHRAGLISPAEGPALRRTGERAVLRFEDAQDPRLGADALTGAAFQEAYEHLRLNEPWRIVAALDPRTRPLGHLNASALRNLTAQMSTYAPIPDWDEASSLSGIQAATGTHALRLLAAASTTT